MSPSPRRARGTRRRRPPTPRDRRSVAPVASETPARIAVLGAGGFIGSHLVPALAARVAGARILAVDRDLRKLVGGPAGVRRIQASIDAPGLLDEVTAQSDVIISLTALCNPALYNTRPLDVIDASYTDLVPLIKLCAARKKRLIHLSTCEVYGRMALDSTGRAMTEMREDETDLCLGPVHKERWSYAAAKQLLERVIWAHGQHADLAFTLVRPFNVIGPRMDFIPGVDGEGIPRVLACFINALLRGDDLILVDGGQQRRAFIAVDEFVDALVRIVERPQVCNGEIINLGNPRNDVTIRELARAVIQAYGARRPAGAPARVRSVSAARYYGVGYEDSVVRIPSIAKAERLLEWHPRVKLADMLPAIIDDYLDRYEGAVAAPPRRRSASGGAR